jgi:hypothetical protein
MCRARPWFLVLPFAVLALAPAWGDHWAPEEITEKFNEVEKKLREFDECHRKDRAANRRILALESTVRDLRTSVRQLQAEVKTLNATLVALQDTLTKTVGTVSPGGAEAGSTPRTARAPTPAEPEGPLAEIVSDRRAKEGNLITITGTVRNVSKGPLTFVVVEATFFGSRGDTLKTESAYTSPRVIAPGAIASFKIVTRHDRRIRRHALSVRAK